MRVLGAYRWLTSTALSTTDPHHPAHLLLYPRPSPRSLLDVQGCSFRWEKREERKCSDGRLTYEGNGKVLSCYNEKQTFLGCISKVDNYILATSPVIYIYAVCNIFMNFKKYCWFYFVFFFRGKNSFHVYFEPPEKSLHSSVSLICSHAFA